MNILVSGGAGFIGSHLVKKLSENHKVTVLDRKIDGIDIGNCFGIYLADLFKKCKFDVVYHLAANSDISSGYPGLDFRDTLKTTVVLLEFCKEYKIREFVFASSSAVYGPSFNDLHEDSPCNPISHYGAAKLASEGYIKSYSHQYGIKAWIIRFPNVVGSNATHGVILDLLRRHKENPELLKVLGTGDQCKPFMHVSELIDAIIYIYDHVKAWVNTYNVAPIGTTSVREIAEMISDNIEYTGGKSWNGDVVKYTFNTDRLSRIGWNPRITSTEAVKLAIEEIRKEI